MSIFSNGVSVYQKRDFCLSGCPVIQTVTASIPISSGGSIANITILSQDITGAVLSNSVSISSIKLINSLQTTTGVVRVYNQYPLLANLTITSNGYAPKTYFNHNLSNPLSFALESTNSVNLLIFDENTNQLITNTNFSIQFISNSVGYNYTTSNGTLYASLLIPNTYTILYSAPSYAQRSYVMTVSNTNNTVVNLYTSNSSNLQNITVSVNALVYVNRYSAITNSFVLTAILETNYQGYATFSGIYNIQYYTFQVYYPTGTLRRSTDRTFIFSSPITLQINTQNTPLRSFYASLQVLSSLTFDSSTNSFVYTYSDPAGTVTRSCLDLYRVRNSGTTFLNTTCVSSSAGSISVGVINTSGTGYRAQTYYIYADSTIQDKSLQKEFLSSGLNVGRFGLFLVVFLMITFVFLGKDNPTIAVILSIIPLAFGAMVGLILLSWTSIIGIFAVYVVVIYILSRRS
jgi:hypothetical protein